MSQNLVLYSDLHIREETKQICDLVLTNVGRIAKKYNARIVNGGDTHDTRGIIKTSSLDILTQHYNKWARDGLEQNILVGNHDQEDREGEIHPMRSYELHSGWHVIDAPTVIDDIAYFPYMPREKIEDAIKAVPKGIKIAVVHWGIRGAKRNDWNTDTDGVPVEWLKRFKRVFSGHYHFRNQFENVQYIGSPYQQNHSEANQPKGVLLYDRKKDEVRFIEIEGTPRHYKVTYKIDDKGKAHVEGEIAKIRKEDRVQVQVEGDSELVNAVTREDLKSYFDCENLKFNREGRVKSHSRLGVAPGETLDSPKLMQKYVDFVDSSLNKKKLMEIGMGLL